MIKAINEILRRDTNVQTAVGLNAAGGKYKIYPLRAPADEQPPYITTSLAANSPTADKVAVSGLDFPTFNINLHATSYDDIETMAAYVRTALDNYTGTTVSTSVTFKRLWYANEFDRDDLYYAGWPLIVRTVQYNAIIKR